MTVTASTLLWRGVSWACGAAALLLATPGPVRWSLGAGLAVLVPLGAALRPNGPAAWFVPLFTLAAWLAVPLTTDPSLPLAFATGAALYAHHSATALAAAWPADVSPAPAVMRGWLVNTGAVVAGSAVAATAIAAATVWPPTAPAELFMALGTLGALGFLVWMFLLVRRKADS